MNYIKQINGFWNWVMINGISQGEMILYMAILHCANISNWKSSLNIPNSTLQSLAKISNASQLNKIRNRLIQTGLISYRKGKGNTSGVYTLVPLYSQSDKQTDKQTDNQTDAERTTYINKTKTKQNETVAAAPKSPKAENELSVPQEVRKAYEQNIGLMSPVICGKIADWLNDTDSDVIIWAIGEATVHGAHNWTYIDRILKNHIHAGRTTLDKILAHNRTFSVKTQDLGIYDAVDYDYDEIERMMQEKYDSSSGGEHSLI